MDFVFGIAAVAGLAGIIFTLGITAYFDSRSKRARASTEPQTPERAPDRSTYPMGGMPREDAAKLYKQLPASIRNTGIGLMLFGGYSLIKAFSTGQPLTILATVFAALLPWVLMLIYNEPASVGVAELIMILTSINLFFGPDDTDILSKIIRGGLILGLLFHYRLSRNLLRAHPHLIDPKPEKIVVRTDTLYPLWSFLCGIAALGMIGLFFVLAILTPSPTQISPVSESVFSLSIGTLSIAAVALGVISLNEGFPRKALSITGLACGAIPYLWNISAIFTGGAA